MTEPVETRRGAILFSVIAPALALALLLAPIPARDLSARVATIEQSRAPIAIVGPSTVDYVSACDTNRHDLARMLSDARHADVLDLSEGGQPMNRSIGLAATVGARGAARDIVLPLTYRGLDDLAVPGYREYVTFRSLDSRVDLIRGAGPRALWSGINGHLGRQFDAFTFEGHAYPDYWKLMAGWFNRESAEKACPEKTAADAAMTRAYYWWTHAQAEINPRLIDMMLDLNADLARRGRRLHVALLPTNGELLAQFDPSWADTVRRRTRSFIEEARVKNLDILDLSDLLPSDAFSTRWCACAHLNERGRAKVVTRLSAFMDEHRATATTPRAAP